MLRRELRVEEKNEKRVDKGAHAHEQLHERQEQGKVGRGGEAGEQEPGNGQPVRYEREQSDEELLLSVEKAQRAEIMIQRALAVSIRRSILVVFFHRDAACVCCRQRWLRRIGGLRAHSGIAAAHRRHVRGQARRANRTCQMHAQRRVVTACRGGRAVQYETRLERLQLATIHGEEHTRRARHYGAQRDHHEHELSEEEHRPKRVARQRAVHLVVIKSQQVWQVDQSEAHKQHGPNETRRGVRMSQHPQCLVRTGHEDARETGPRE